MLLFLVSPCLTVAVQPCTKWIPIKKNGEITLVLLLWNWKMLGLIFPSKWIEGKIFLTPRKLEPWLVLWNVFLLRFICISAFEFCLSTSQLLRLLPREIFIFSNVCWQIIAKEKSGNIFVFILEISYQSTFYFLRYVHVRYVKSYFIIECVKNEPTF